MLLIGAGCALGSVVADGLPRLAVVEGDEGSLPWLLANSVEEVDGPCGYVDGVAFGGDLGKSCEIRLDFVAELVSRGEFEPVSID